MSIEDSPKRLTNYPFDALIGSIIRSTDGSFWYCCGSWTVNDVKDALPCILSYVPADRHTEQTRQKSLELHGQKYLKVFGQPLSSYRDTYLSMVEGFVEKESLGKVSFLPIKHIQEIKDPHSFTSTYINKIPKDGKALRNLCRLIEVDINDVGITGSSLMFGEPVKRHELDFGIYGREKSRRAYEILEEARRSNVITSASDYHHLPFYYEGVVFDPQFGEAKGEVNPINGAKIEIVGEISNLFMTIKKSPDAIFFPAVYGISGNRRLVSFRPGQRDFFKTGQNIRFDSMSVANITTVGGSEEVFLAINDETASIITKQ